MYHYSSLSPIQHPNYSCLFQNIKLDMKIIILGEKQENCNLFDIENARDRMYFENLSDLAGKEIWVWPGKRHQMRFRVNNATSEVLEGVSIKYRTMVNHGIFTQDENGNILQNTNKLP